MTQEEIRNASEKATPLAAKFAEFSHPNPYIARALRTRIASTSKQAASSLSAEELARLRRITEELRTAHRSKGPAAPGADRSPSKPAPARRRVKLRADEQIARRVVKRHRDRAFAFLERAELTDELGHLVEVENRLRKGTAPDCRYAAFAARNLMEGIADRLFPPTSEAHLDRSDHKHLLGGKDHKNRLIAYVEQRLKGQLEGHDFRAFVGTMDVVMRWTGSGPHGACKLEDAEHHYTRMLDALTIIARAHSAG